MFDKNKSMWNFESFRRSSSNPNDLQFLLRVEEVHEALLQIETIPLFFFQQFFEDLTAT